MADLNVEIVHHNIQQRQSIGHLVEPSPSTEQLNLAFEAALAAPDHHRLKPTRFVIIPKEKREEFGDMLSSALGDLGETTEPKLDRVKKHPFRAPLLVLALTELKEHPKVPEFEQILSSGAAIENFLLSLQVQGFATIWRSGAVVESVWFKEQLGLKSNDLISGIIYIGTADKNIAPREPVELADFVSIWTSEV